VGSKVTGVVVSLTDYGAFVELEEGIEGLIHVSEMSWTRKVRHPSKVVSVGEEVEAVVLDIKPESRRISLGMKQVVPNPWDVIAEKYPVGTTIEGKIKNITDFGLFIGIDEGIDGLVHICLSALMRELTVWCTYPTFPGSNASSILPSCLRRGIWCRPSSWI
jgi:small subunit ribosomal protein S1